MPMPMPMKSRKACRACGVAVQRVPDVYCNRECQKEYEHRERDAAVRESGCVTPHYVDPRAIKGFIVRERGNRCEVCGGATWHGQPMPLVLDHINGDSGDNSVLNLRLVCGNCDMLLPTYKSKNRGQGRHSRRVRYADGKSF